MSKVMYTIKVNHKIDNKELNGRTLVLLENMTKDGNYYEYVKCYKMDKDCPDISNGSTGSPLFTANGKVGAWQSDGAGK